MGEYKAWSHTLHFKVMWEPPKPRAQKPSPRIAATGGLTLWPLLSGSTPGGCIGSSLVNHMSRHRTMALR
nr:MAG TPA: hypothetical protein [Caudoviricetes sp.]DAL97268.1 MAG TPA: hypothetical protein [Caudoviricetes sp.]